MRWRYGFYEQYRNGVRVIAHGGDLTAFHSELVLIPSAKVGLFISFNSSGKDELRLQAAHRGVRSLHGSLLPAPGAAARCTAGRHEGARRRRRRPLRRQPPRREEPLQLLLHVRPVGRDGARRRQTSRSAASTASTASRRSSARSSRGCGGGRRRDAPRRHARRTRARRHPRAGRLWSNHRAAAAAGVAQQSVAAARDPGRGRHRGTGAADPRGRIPATALRARRVLRRQSPTRIGARSLVAILQLLRVHRPRRDRCC